jgi:hypothetical protein
VPPHGYVVGLDIGVPDVLPVLARDVADAQQGSFGASDYGMRRHVAIDVHEIQPEIGVEIALSDCTEQFIAVG